VVHPDLRRQRVQALLCYLVIEPHVRRQEVAAALWPELSDGGRNLRVTLNYLQRLFQPDRPPGEPAYFLRDEGAWLRLTGGVHLDVDAWELENRLDEADDAERSAAPTAALAAYRSALSLWRGEPYASVPYADWAEAARTRLRRRFVTAAVRAAQLELAAGQLDRAQDTAERATRADPWSEPAYRVLVQADLALGDRAAARRALDACRSALAELGVAPEPATVALEQALFTPP